MAGKPGLVVTGLTAAALVAVGILGTQASGSAKQPVAAPTVSASPSPSPTHSAKSKPKPPAVPAHSGSGLRVVYALGAQRVWLVDAHGTAKATFPVWRSTVDPKPGSYHVYYLNSHVSNGSDGERIRYVVLFNAGRLGITIGFSAALDNSSPKPVPGRQTGGIRMTVANGKKLYDFAHPNTTVVVVK